MKQLSLDVLRTFVTIVDIGNFNRAGELLGRSQPAISLQIKKLEGQLDKKLFNKVGQSYQVNADGKWLYQKAKTMLAMNDDVFREFSSESLKGRLRLGIPSEFASALLPSIVGEFSQRYPDVSLDVTSALSKHLLENKQAAQYDLILALINPDEDLSHTNGAISLNPKIEIVREDDLVWVGDKNRHVRHQTFAQNTLPLVLAPDGCIYRSRVIAQLKQQTQPWKITYTNPDFYGLMAAIKQGLGITALARSIVPDELEIVKDKALPALGKINICLLNQDTLHPQVSQTLANYIKARIE
jgi:DNA-binding transcriptional LysR family regulator